MRASLNWLCELVSGLPRDAERIAHELTTLGLEVEAVRAFAAGIEPLRIARVLGAQPHPSRSKLRLVRVSLGQSERIVVCGAGNVPEPGGLVVLAPLGTRLPAISLTLAARDIGGVVSEGMLCSEKELGLAADSDGIMTFEPGTFEPGRAFCEAFPAAQDTILELGITPNRPDALGHVGIARDLAARLGLPLSLPVAKPPEGDASLVRTRVAIENRAPELCPRYGAAVVDGIRIAPSPAWLRWRLCSLGVRPVSNVVDVTNLLLLEWGNPMHAFDLERVTARRIVIRTAAPNEPMTTLDGRTHELLESDLVIADAEQPSALAGIMGGLESEIRSETRSVLLECAYFEPTGIRRTSRRLAVSTDSSHRFERGVDHGALEVVLSRACQLLSEVASGKPVPGLSFADGRVPLPPEITLRSARLDALLGMPVDFDRAKNLLERLGFEAVQADATRATFRGASFRPDVTLEADLIEEVARLLGLDAIPNELPSVTPTPPTSVGQLERRCRSIARELGASEAVSYAFVSRGALEALGAAAPVVRLLNPFSEEREVMTTSLLPGLLEALGRAQRHGEACVSLFSVRSIFLAPERELADEGVAQTRQRERADLEALPEERSSFALLLWGQRPAYLQKPSPYDVFDVKGFVVELMERLLARAVTLRPTTSFAHLHPRVSAEVLVGEHEVGRLGTLHPDLCHRFELLGPVHVAELDLAALQALERVTPAFAPIPRLPAITRDMALDAPQTLPVGELHDAIEGAAGELCESVELFDVFRQPDSERRSLAFRLVYRDPKARTQPELARTLTDEEVEALQRKVVERAAQLGAMLRG